MVDYSNRPGATVSDADAKAWPGNRTISGDDFLKLWLPAEVGAAFAADPRLIMGALKAASQDSVNLDSPELDGLLALAVSKGALTADRAAQIKAGTAPS